MMWAAQISWNASLAFFHSVENWGINLQNRNYKSTTNEAVKLTAWFCENKNTTRRRRRRRRRRDDPLCKLRSARENPFSLSVPEESPGSGLRSEINLARSFVIHVYLQERRQANGGSSGKGKGRDRGCSKYEIWRPQRWPGVSLFGSFRFVAGDGKSERQQGRSSTTL